MRLKYVGDVVIHTIPHLLLGDHHEEHVDTSHTSGKETHDAHRHEHSDEHDHNDHGHHDHSDHGHGHGHHGGGHDENHENMIYVGVLVLIGFLVFFIAEKVASSRGHSHSHSHEVVTDEVSSLEEIKEVIVSGTSPEKSDKSNKNLRKRNVTAAPSDILSKPVNKVDLDVDVDYKNGKNKNDKKAAAGTANVSSISAFFPSFSKLSTPGWLNLLADSMHNFTDGIAIGTV